MCVRVSFFVSLGDFFKCVYVFACLCMWVSVRV